MPSPGANKLTDRRPRDRRADAASFGAAAAFLGALTGWRRWMAAWLLGLASALALPPVGTFPVAFIVFPALVWQIDGTPSRRASVALGWWFGLGHFMAGTYWISNALLIEADRFAWLIPFTLVGVSAYLALYPALACGFARWIRPGWGRIAALAASWTGLEMVRGLAFTGFPWNPIGSIWTGIPAMLQSAAFIGVFGLGLITVALAAAPAMLAAGRAPALRVAVGVPAVVALIWAAGAWRLSRAETAIHPGLALGIVQANIPQREKIRSDLKARHFGKHLRMTAETAGDGITHFIWPETAIGFALSRAPGAAEAVARLAPPGGLIITGALRATPEGEKPFRLWNSLQAIDVNGRIAASYDKAHLVPFGEFVPWRSVLAFTQVTAGRFDFSRGPGPRTVTVAGLPPFSPLICYEIIFPGAVVGRGERPAWLLNITNDGWFGQSAGPYQHFASARMRAVEEGLPVVRAANSGISGVIDAYGRVGATLGLGRAGVLEVGLPKPPVSATVFSRVGHWPAIVLIVVFCAGLPLCLRDKRIDLP